MHADYQQLMAEATRLTQTGDLSAATALIQRALRGDGADAAATTPTWPADRAGTAAEHARVIDVQARTVADPAAATDGSSAVRPTPPAVGQFNAGSYAHPTAGRRDYKLYVPHQAGEGRQLPLVVMLHGCTQDPDDFARGTAMNEAAEAQGLFVLYPAQSADMNPQRCWNWFKHNHQQRGHGEPAVLAGMVQELIAQQPIDPARVYVAGLSAGGAMAAILGEAYPDLFAAVGVHSGLAAGAANDLPSAFGAMQGNGGAPARPASGMPTIVFHGDADHTVSIKNAKQVIDASVGGAATLQAEPPSIEDSGRRQVTRQVHRNSNGDIAAEIWTIHGAPHAWAGGHTAGSFTDPSGPDATRQMLRFFAQHARVTGR